MPVLDIDSRRITVRIVYDGPAEAGKTTNVRQLHGFFTDRRRGELFAPDEEQGRTLYFDWFELDGGLVAGHRLRCQIVSVPGQQVLSRRRRHLLRQADVVVFVCASHASGVESARAHFELLREHEGMPVVVQANKQDLAGALAPHDVVRGLGGDPERIPSVGAIAEQASGVRETLVLAVRAAADRVQLHVTKSGGLDSLLGRPDTAQQTLEAMLREERERIPQIAAVAAALATTDAPAIEVGGSPLVRAVQMLEERHAPASGEEVEVQSSLVSSIATVEEPADAGIGVEDARSIEEARDAEEARVAEEARRAEEARLIEEARLAEEARRAEEARLIEEARLAEEARRAEEARLIEEARLAEEARRAEEARLAEEARVAEEACRAEEARLIEEARVAEEARRAEEARLIEEARLAEEARRAEEARLVEEARLAEEARRAEEARLAEEARRAEEARLAEEAARASASESDAPAGLWESREVAASPPIELPPMPDPEVPSYSIWPPAVGRTLLRRIDTTKALLRADLTGRQHKEDGSGATDVIILQASGFCLKTSPRRRFRAGEEGRAELVRLARKKARLGRLLAPETVLCLAYEQDGAAWLWSVAPWVRTHRRRMADAEALGDAVELGHALEEFADVAIESIVLASTSEVVLDVNPSNFGTSKEGPCYLDDDIGAGSSMPMIAHALVARADEYATHPAAVEAYVARLEQLLAQRISRRAAQQIELAAGLHALHPRTPSGLEAQRRLVRVVERLR